MIKFEMHLKCNGLDFIEYTKPIHENWTQNTQTSKEGIDFVQ